MPAVLFPRFDHPAIEERYASWQSQTLLRGGGATEFVTYDAEEPASLAVAGLESDHVLVVTDPLVLPPAKLITRLRELLVHTSIVVAALPVSNEAENFAPRRSPRTPYLTLRELQQMTAELQAGRPAPEGGTWSPPAPPLQPF